METSGKKVIELNIEDVLPNRFQPRIKFNEEAINELSKSIKEHGVIQPIVVRPIGDKFEIIAGERRYKASKIADLKTIPAIITDLNDKDSAEVALIENVQRENLTPIEEAISYKKILDMGYITQDALATKLGKTQSTVANKLRLLNLDDEVQEALLNEKISERHARSLLKLQTPTQQKQMLERIIGERLTVRRADEEIEKMINGQKNEDNQENNFEQIFKTEINSIQPPLDQQISNNSLETMDFQPKESENKTFTEGFRFINNNIQNQEELEEKIEEETKIEEQDDEDIKPKKFFNILDEINGDKEKEEQKTEDNRISEPTFTFDKILTNESDPSYEKINPILEEINEIENSINNSNTIPPIFNNQDQQIEKTKEENQKDIEEKYDDFDDDANFVENEQDQQPINIEQENQEPHTIAETKITDFKDVLEEIRDCSKKIEKSGFEIHTEEIDLNGEYQVIFKIKNN